ncbi:MAG: hypothetical protein IJ789_06040 [Bacteroidales bacterium]|nr:hypothetical protein [Bacteroidales bacterium]
MKNHFLKLTLLASLFLATVSSLNAQDCTEILLAKFNNDTALINDYPQVKLDYYCHYAQNAFYLSDELPEGAEVKPLTQVYNLRTGDVLTEQQASDLTSLIYYEYNFNKLQLQYYRGNITICFPLTNSLHKYLVLRSLDEIYDRTEFPHKYNK